MFYCYRTGSRRPRGLLMNLVYHKQRTRDIQQQPHTNNTRQKHVLSECKVKHDAAAAATGAQKEPFFRTQTGGAIDSGLSAVGAPLPSVLDCAPRTTVNKKNDYLRCTSI